MKEEWRNIKEYPGYEVSNLGKVRSTTRIIRWRCYPGKILKPDIGKNKYHRVMLIKGKRELVHRLVGNAFVSNPLKKPQINHRDNNPENNKYSNLEWVTASENQLYSIRQGRGGQSKNRSHGENHYSSKLKEKDVENIREMRYRLSYRKIGKIFGVNHGSIKNIMLRRTWKHM